MGRQERLAIIKEIEQAREANLICYVTGDRENVGTRIAPDVLRVFYRHLKSLGPKTRLDLFLYTRGGDVLTPWRLTNLIREYAAYFSLLIPFRAYSAGTLLALGANEIVMTRMGELGPIDPSVANAFNPDDPRNPAAKIPVSVEDVSAYLNLADLAGLKDQPQRAEIFKLLSEKVHPLALGNVYRNYMLIRSLARKLLLLHMDEAQENRTREIVDNLTERLYAHNYMISRQEAREEIGLNVTRPPEKLEELLWALYEEYEEDLQLAESFDPLRILAAQEKQVDFEVSGGVVESEAGLDSFIFTGSIQVTGTDPQGKPAVNVDMRSQRWIHIV